MELLPARYCGLSSMNSVHETHQVHEDAMKTRLTQGNPPFTASQSVATVCGHSYKEMVKPAVHHDEQLWRWHHINARTVNFVVLFHVNERIKIRVTQEVDAGPA